MRQNDKPEASGELRKALNQWKLETALPPDFQARVWRRIAHEETVPQPGIWERLWAGVEAALGQPRYAAAYVGVLVLLGLGGGYFQARQAIDRTEAGLSERYVQAIDPYRMPFR